MKWRLLTYRLAGDQSRHRVAVWRELRRVGAVALQSATWVVPVGDGFDHGVERATALVQRAGGQALCFEVRAEEDTLSALESLYTAEREAEWTEFAAECERADTELRHEIESRRFSLAELDQKMQQLDRLRHWYRDLRAKDLFVAPSATHGEQRLEDCARLLEEYAECVYATRERR